MQREEGLCSSTPSLQHLPFSVAARSCNIKNPCQTANTRSRLPMIFQTCLSHWIWVFGFCQFFWTNPVLCITTSAGKVNRWRLNLLRVWRHCPGTVGVRKGDAGNVQQSFQKTQLLKMAIYSGFSHKKR